MWGKSVTSWAFENLSNSKNMLCHQDGWYSYFLQSDIFTRREQYVTKNLDSVSIFVIKGPVCSINKSSLHLLCEKKIYKYYKQTRQIQRRLPASTGLHSAIYILSDRWFWQEMENMESHFQHVCVLRKTKRTRRNGVKGNMNCGRCRFHF